MVIAGNLKTSKMVRISRYKQVGWAAPSPLMWYGDLPPPSVVKTANNDIFGKIIARMLKTWIIVSGLRRACHPTPQYQYCKHWLWDKLIKIGDMWDGVTTPIPSCGMETHPPPVVKNTNNYIFGKSIARMLKTSKIVSGLRRASTPPTNQPTNRPTRTANTDCGKNSWQKCWNHQGWRHVGWGHQPPHLGWTPPPPPHPLLSRLRTMIFLEKLL